MGEGCIEHMDGMRDLLCWLETGLQESVYAISSCWIYGVTMDWNPWIGYQAFNLFQLIGRTVESQATRINC